jgi:FkbM family methyltransferase
MSLLRAIRRVFSEEGPASLLRESVGYASKTISNTYISKGLELVYRSILPEYVRFEIDGTIGKFDTSILSRSTGLRPITGLRHIFYTEKDVISSFMDDLEEDDVFYDVGANLGMYSVFAGKRLGSGTVVAFDPQPAVIPTLYRNLDENCGKFEVVQMALSNKRGFGKIRTDFAAGADVKRDSGITVRLERIENIIESARFRAPTVVKVDVEGVELDVLKGFGETLGSVEVAYVEVHDLAGEGPESNLKQVVGLLEDHFEDVSKINVRGENGQAHLRATSR